MTRLLPFVLLAAALLLAPPLEAQTPGVRVAALAGVDGIGGDEPHPFFGGELGATYWKLGLLASGFFGSGNEFSSRLVALAPAYRVWDGGRADVYLTGGVGQYAETLDTGPSRDTVVFTGGLSGRIPAGPVRVALHLTAFTGSFGSSADGGSPISVNGLRLAIGLGL